MPTANQYKHGALKYSKELRTKKPFVTHEKTKVKINHSDKIYNYIDPGTGSMLFSLLIGLATALFFSVKTIFIKLKFLFLNRKNKIKKEGGDIVIYSEGKQYWNTFCPILEEFEKRETEIIFYTSSNDDPVFNQNYKYVKSKYIGEGNKAFFKLMFTEANICLMTTPGLDVYQLKRSKGIKHYSHILHAVDDATNYRLFGLDFFDSVLLSGEYQKAGIREIEEKRGLPPKELIVVGSTYLDELKKKIEQINLERNNYTTTILVAPSWGKEGMLSKYGLTLINKLIDTGAHVIIRPHPQSLKVEQKIIEEIKNNTKNIEWDFKLDNIDALSRADIMITDFSAIMFDYAFLFNRPFIYINNDFNPEMYDFSDCDNEAWKFQIAREIGIELTIDKINNLDAIINQALNNEEIKNKIQYAKNIAWQFIGKSGELTADYLVQKNKELKEC